jgi:exodeoxyribonuclease V alpha subunit
MATLTARHPEIAWEDNSEARLRELTVAGWAPLMRRLTTPEAALAALPGFQLMCAHRRGRWGSEHLTDEVRTWLQQAGHLASGEDWYPGRPIIVLVNDHAQDLWNGDTGIVLGDADGRLRVHFPRSGESLTRALSIAQLPAHATFYATTIHKAQGSSFEHVLALLPPEPSPVVTRELLYTAVTRARQKVTLMASEAVVRHAVRTRVQRASGLAAALGVRPPHITP